MNIKLKSLHLVNFRGAKKRDIEFTDSTTISGGNGTGKSTVFTAFMWLLFGKDQFDRKDFAVKPIAADGTTTPKLDTEVSATLTVDGINISLRRISAEKWTKRRGSETEEFTGNETKYYKNEVPVSQKDYQEFIASIIPEIQFKMLTSVDYFANLPWKDKRDLLFQMAGEITDQDVAAGNEAFIELLSRGTKLETLKKELAAKRKELSEELNALPVRIDEAQRSKPEPVDADMVNLEIASKRAVIAQIDDELANVTKSLESVNNAYTERLKLIQANKSKLAEIQTQQRQLLFESSSKRTAAINAKKLEIQKEQGFIDSVKSEIETNTKSITRISSDITSLRTKIDELNALTPDFSSIKDSCPWCQQSLPEGNIEIAKEDVRKNFNADKKLKADRINEDGVKMKSELERLQMIAPDLEKRLDQYTKNLSLLNSELEALQAEAGSTVTQSLDDTLKSIPEYVELTNQTLELEALPKPEAPDSSEKLAQKESLQTEIDALNSSLSAIETIANIDKRVAELEARNKVCASEIAKLESQEMTIAAFEKAKVEMTNEKINSCFRFVTFKMYNKLINGGDEPCCDILINGVPYADANTASQINAGMDIIETFSRHYNVTAPIFIDRAESVNTLYNPKGAQVIKLVVTTEKALTVTSDELEAAAN
jgi:exonuclease SbcC